MSCYSETDYPKIYSKTYWGTFDFSLNSRITTDIINSRNLFIKHYDILNIVSPNYFLTDHINIEHRKVHIDHLEIYKTNSKNYILLSSPFGRYDNYLENGWIKIDNLYSTEAVSFIKHIDNPHKRTPKSKPF